MCGLVSWSDITSKGDDLLNRCMWRVHPEDMLDFEPLLLNSDIALSRDEDNAMDFLEEMVIPVRFPIGFLGVAEGVDGVLLLADYEGILSAAKGAIINPELSKVGSVSEQLLFQRPH
jgi:hypothetical protein